jgi:hypothetical protein
MLPDFFFPHASKSSGRKYSRCSEDRYLADSFANPPLTPVEIDRKVTDEPRRIRLNSRTQ